MSSIGHEAAMQAQQPSSAADAVPAGGIVTSKDAARAHSLADAFLLVSALLALPSEDLLDAVGSGAVGSDADGILGELGADDGVRGSVAACWAAEQAAAGDPAAAASRVRREYTRLFTSPERRAMNIYEAAFRFSLEEAGLSGTFMGSLAARDAKRHYRAAGVELKVMESADHMGIECEYLGICLRQVAASAAAGERAPGAGAPVPDADAWLERIRAFGREHVDRWFADFFERLGRETSQDYYRAVSMLGAAATESLKAFSQAA